jgi:1,4-dihydroxy-2-naphthoate octaprenyltransferase
MQLAAPHTWPASVIPSCLGVALAYALMGRVSLPLALILLLISVLMQAAVNTFNDYFDFIKGTDSAEDNLEETDAVLVYNHVNPRSVLTLAIIMLAFAFGLGGVIIYYAGLIPLYIALIGALITVFYSGGKMPLSYLPVGEIVSGFVMGGLIPLACFYTLTGLLWFEVLWWALPVMLGIALIMMTNNTCDIEKDIEAKRTTLPVVLKRKRAVVVYHSVLVVWAVLVICNVIFTFKPGTFVLPFAALASWPFLKNIWNNPLTQASRIPAMGQICTLNVVWGAFYLCCILV